MGRAPITAEECERISEMHDDGRSYAEIASELGCSPSTVGIHCRGECRHENTNDRSINLAVVEFLLPRLASKLQRIPSMRDWNDVEQIATTADPITYGRNSGRSTV